MTDVGQDSASPRWSLEAKVLGLVGSVRDRAQGGPMSRGDRAELRRMRDADALPPEPFWTLVARYEIAARDEPFWRAVIPLMVEFRHRPGITAGRALAAARVSGSRVERWLRYDAARARSEAYRLLSKVEDGFDWVRFARLLHNWDDNSKLGFARDYFLAPELRTESAS